MLDPRLGQCATNEIPPFVPPCRALVAAAIANGFPNPGFDEGTDSVALSPGDSATILATQFEKDGRREQWVILLQVVPPTERERSRKAASPKTVYTSLGHKFDFAPERTFVSVRTIGPFLAAGSDLNAPRVEDETARLALDTGFLRLGFDRAAAAGHRVSQMETERKPRGSLAFGEKPFSEPQISEGKEIRDGLSINARGRTGGSRDGHRTGRLRWPCPPNPRAE
jgi:hypothetical protein